MEKCLHMTDFTSHFSTWHDFSLYLPCGDLSPTEHLSCGDTSPHDNLSHGKTFSTWQIFSPQPPVVMVVTNIRYGITSFTKCHLLQQSQQLVTICLHKTCKTLWYCRRQYVYLFLIFWKNLLLYYCGPCNRIIRIRVNCSSKMVGSSSK